MAKLKITADSAGKPNSFGVFIRSYSKLIALLLVLAIIANGLALMVPKVIAVSIDSYTSGHYSEQTVVWRLVALLIAAAFFTLLQSVVSIYTSEVVARDLRLKLAAAISKQSFAYVVGISAATLLTNFTSDVDAVKSIVSQGFVNIFSSILTLIGALIILFTINARLTLIALCIVPFIALSFGVIIGRIGKLFRENQENLERINRTVNESIVASSLVRVLNAQSSELIKFNTVNSRIKAVGDQIIRNFSALIPIVTMLANVITLSIIWFGGGLVARGELSLGNFSAFFSYTALLIMPIIIVAFVSNMLTRSFISYSRISTVLASAPPEYTGTVSQIVQGDIELKDIFLSYGQNMVLKNISFYSKAGTRTAIVGPTAAGKTQLLYLLSGLVPPQEGHILLGGIPLERYEQRALMGQIGLVFQDSIIFNASLLENITFGDSVDPIILDRAITTAGLSDLVESLPEGLQTFLSERGGNLSGGQKQRVTLARALVLNPLILLLDDFTARVDRATEATILENLRINYPKLTLVSITQKIKPIEDYDQIILVMEGEILAAGTHAELLETSLEYKTIYDSQQSSEE